jgi:hypothetical protein
MHGDCGTAGRAAHDVGVAANRATHALEVARARAREHIEIIRWHEDASVLVDLADFVLGVA